MIKKRKGFTLIEILISLTIFFIISTISLGVFTSLIKSQRLNDLRQQSLNEARTLIEIISREFRTGSKYQIVTPGSTMCPNALDQFPAAEMHCMILTNQIENSVSYYKDSQNALHRLEKDAQTEKISHIQMSSERVAIKEFNAVLSSDSEEQDRITIELKIANILLKDEFNHIETEDPFYLQTTITSRNYEDK